MRLKNVSSGESFPATIEEINEKDLKWIKKSSEFSFDWSTENGYEVYKIYLAEDDRKGRGVSGPPRPFSIS